MITKGTEDYKKASKLANELSDYANVNRRNNSYFDIAFENLGRVITVVENTNTFAANIAKTVDNTMKPGSWQVAYLSSKQAWILACCVVENNLDIERKSIYGI